MAAPVNTRSLAGPALLAGMGFLLQVFGLALLGWTGLTRGHTLAWVLPYVGGVAGWLGLAWLGARLGG